MTEAQRRAQFLATTPREFIACIEAVPFDVVRQYTEMRVAAARAALRAYVEERQLANRRKARHAQPA